MDWKLFATVFGTVFLAELGDKTQLATLLFASEAKVSRLNVFFAASLALVAATAIGVLAGSLLGHYVNTQWLNRIAGIGFVAIGIWTFLKA